MVTAKSFSTIISDLFFDPKDGEEKLKSATRIFTRPADADEDNCYAVHIKQTKLFKLVIEYVALGASFRLASRQVAAAREQLGLGYLGGCNEAKVSSFVRVALAANMQKFKELLANCWAFSVMFDSATVEGSSLFDIWIRFAFKGRLFCFHLLSLPMTGRHTGQNMYNLFEKVMDVVVRCWKDTLLSASLDGVRNMTGHARGIVSLISRNISPDRTLLRTWCGAHQLNLVFQKAVSKLCNNTFYHVLTALIGYLCRQFNFIADVGGKCPKVATTRWLSLGRVLKWLTLHRARVMAYLDEKNPVCKPPPAWWLTAIAVEGVTTEVDVLFKTLQGKHLLVQQQINAFGIFILRLHELAHLVRPLTSVQVQAFQPATRPSFMSPSDSPVVFAISADNVVSFIRGRGSYATAKAARLDADSFNSIVSSLGVMLVDLATGIAMVCPERDSNNEAIHNEPLLCLPFAFAAFRESDFVHLVIKMRSRLESKWNSSKIDSLEAEHRQLCTAAFSERQFKSMLEEQDDSTSFKKAWGGGLAERFPLLCEFGGGLASTYPGTSRVESDFSILGVEKNAYQTSLMDLSLDGIMHAKQFSELQAI